MKYFRSKSLPPLECQNQFEVLSDIDTVFQAQQLGADFIDLSYADYVLASEIFVMNSIDAYTLGSADCLLKINDQHYFYQLSQKAFLNYLSDLKISLQSSDAAVLVGDQLTISQFLPALTKLGYSHFVFVVEKSENVVPFVNNIQKTFLGLKIQILNFKQVSLIDCVSSFLLVDIDHQKHSELVESLTYFNFLTTGSVFFDVRSAQGNDLVEEALRAQMFVIDGVLFAETRWALANQILTKNIK